MNKRLGKASLLVLMLCPALFLMCSVSKIHGRNDCPITVAVFSGHTALLNSRGNNQGARSASGIYEYRFNDLILNTFAKIEHDQITYKILPATLNIPFQNRPRVAKRLGASVAIEIHHDSVQPRIYERLIRARPGDSMLNYYRGFSIHVYPDPASIALAKAVESEMISRKLVWSEYHTEDIPGERMMLVEGTKAIYERGTLSFLQHAPVPALIIECACIANPVEEELAKTEDYARTIAQSVHHGILKFRNETGLCLKGKRSK